MIRRYEKLELQKEREEKERIKEVNDLKLQLFTNISHDFRTPLTLIVGPLEKMIADNLSPPFVVKQHKIMHKNAMILLQLVNQFLDFRKNESGQFKLEATENNIVPFVEEIKKSFDELAAEKRIDFNLKYANRKIDVWFDKVKLRKIIYNLLSNAFKNTKVEGQVGIHISTEEKLNTNNQMGQFVKLEVRDTGKGIAKENIKFIFERFYQLGQKHGGSLGTGIGLSLTKSLVNLHKGFIDIKSTEGKGSSFTVLLPLGNSHLSEQEIIEEQTDETEDSLAYNTPFHLLGKTNPSQDEVDSERDASLSTILIVEDNNDVRSFLKTIFSPGFNILEAEDGKKGLEIAKTESLDLIISDIMMPIVDGVELCKAIKTDIKTSHIPVVLLTAKTSAESQRSGYESGADIYIPKPFNPELLVTRVNNLIQSRQNLIEKFRKDAIVEPKAIAATSTDELFLEKAFKIVMDNVSNPEFAINNLAKDLHMSRSILYKKIKALTGQTIHQFVKTIKLKHAGQLLIARKDLNISEVAYEIGFSDVKHFRKLFKELFKELPSDYRNNPVHHKDKEVLDS
jgi:DNA-binding response OmpR family regulator/nitrogen-specific signal transduction histidine kinase